jgi:hypothetical protein
MLYSIIEEEGCRIIRGELSLIEMATIMMSTPDGHQVDPTAARMLNAKIVIGPPDALERLRSAPHTLARAFHLAATQEGWNAAPPNLRLWLAAGERGASAESIVSHLTGMPGLRSGYHPLDLDDFRRCRLLLQRVPELNPRLSEMVSVSRHWACLMPRWHDICAKMDEESPDWARRLGSAPVAATVHRQTLEGAPA